MLTSKQRSYLRSLATNEDTILHIGKGGVTEQLIRQADDALRARELIKGRVLEASMLTARASSAIAAERKPSDRRWSNAARGQSAGSMRAHGI